ncbi:type II toxin-antitoxin system RelE family toxin [Treponema sp. R6D11]
MSYCLQIQDRAIKSIKKISEPHKTLIKRKIEMLKDFTKDMPNIKALQGNYKGLYRLRIGDYRVLFDVADKSTIIILDIFARKEGY